MAGIPATEADFPLLKTKLFVPRMRSDLVVRPRLIERLGHGGARCTLLTAQAGAGKTTLLAAWLAQRESPVAWLSLDERDQEPHRFVRYLVAALRTVAPDCGRAALAWLDGPPVPVDVVLTSLINDLAALPRGTVLVLDDYHVVRADAVHAAVTFLLDHLPPVFQLVISTREDPPLPMARLRGRGEVVELRAADLGFTDDEASDLLIDGMALPLSEAQVATLVTRTEGWAAGLQLAGLALRSRTDVAAFVTAFTGSHRLVADYLAAEVLDRQPVEVQRFLSATCFLDRMCAPLCDAVLGGSDAQAVLEGLERANLFLVPLDDERLWFRYHHLFAQVLQARAARDGDPDGRAVHRRASAWFGRAGLLPEAIEHALAAGDVDDAAAMVESVVPMMLVRFDIHSAMDGWLDALTEATVRGRSMLCLARAWLLIHLPRPAEAHAWVAAAEQAAPDGDAGRRIRGAAATLRALAGAFAPALAPAVSQELAERALADLTPADVGFRVVAGVVLGQAELALGRIARAEEAVAEATATGRASGLRQASFVAAAHLGVLQRLRGEHRAAMATTRSAIAWAAEQGTTTGHAAVVLSTQLADLLLDAGDVAAAQTVAEEALWQLRRLRQIQMAGLIARLCIVRVQLAGGDPDGAANVLEEARSLHTSSAGVELVLAAAEAEAQLARGDGATAARWASSAAPLELPSPLGLQTQLFMTAVEALGVAPARVLVAHGLATGSTTTLQAGAQRVDHLRHLAAEFGLGAVERVVLVLDALVADGRGDRDAALSAVAAAAARCVPEGVFGPFLSVRAPIVGLVAAARAQAAGGSPAAADLEAVLAACAPIRPQGRAAAIGLVEALTLREHEVLRLVADGRTNAEIARALVVEQSTVKTHLLHVYRKLAVRSRTQALARARTLHLVD